MNKHTPVEVLMVEDTAEDAELIRRALRKTGFASQIHHVEDGEQALDILFGGNTTGSNLPRVVLLDISLPRLSGLQVLQRIRENPATRRLPVVMVTSSREDIDLEQAYAIGANSYVVKPVDFTQFVDAIHQLGLYWLMINEVPRHSDG